MTGPYSYDLGVEPPSQDILSHYDIQAPLPLEARVNTWRSATVTLDTHNTPRDLSAHPASHPPPAPPSLDDSVLSDALEESEVLEHVRVPPLDVPWPPSPKQTPGWG